MLKRFASVSTLACALLLIASTSVLSSTPDENRGSTIPGVAPGTSPGPSTAGMGSTGDDDAPFVDTQTDALDTIVVRAGKPSRSIVLRAYEAHVSPYLTKLRLMKYWSARR